MNIIENPNQFQVNVKEHEFCSNFSSNPEDPALSARKAASKGYITALHVIFNTIKDDPAQIDKTLTATSSNGNSPIDWAIQNNHSRCIHFLCDIMVSSFRTHRTQAIESLYNKIITQQNIEKGTPFEAAWKYQDMMQKMIQRLNVIDQMEQTVLSQKMSVENQELQTLFNQFVKQELWKLIKCSNLALKIMMGKQDLELMALCSVLRDKMEKLLGSKAKKIGVIPKKCFGKKGTNKGKEYQIKQVEDYIMEGEQLIIFSQENQINNQLFYILALVVLFEEESRIVPNSVQSKVKPEIPRKKREELSHLLPLADKVWEEAFVYCLCMVIKLWDTPSSKNELISCANENLDFEKGEMFAHPFINLTTAFQKYWAKIIKLIDTRISPLSLIRIAAQAIESGEQNIAENILEKLQESAQSGRLEMTVDLQQLDDLIIQYEALWGALPNRMEENGSVVEDPKKHSETVSNSKKCRKKKRGKQEKQNVVNKGIECNARSEEEIKTTENSMSFITVSKKTRNRRPAMQSAFTPLPELTLEEQRQYYEQIERNEHLQIHFNNNPQQDLTAQLHSMDIGRTHSYKTITMASYEEIKNSGALLPLFQQMAAKMEEIRSEPEKVDASFLFSFPVLAQEWRGQKYDLMKGRIQEGRVTRFNANVTIKKQGAHSESLSFAIHNLYPDVRI